jgi:hypothetical protein
MKTQWLSGFIGIALSCLLTCNVDARTWYVNPNGSGDALTVQAGIDSAVAGDTVLVASGTYHEHDLLMKSGLCLKGETNTPPSATIDAQYQGKLMMSMYVTTSTIENLLFANGTSWGMEIYGSLTVRNCVFAGNSGTAVGAFYGGPEFFDCVFYGNNTGLTSVYWANPLLNNCTFVNNYRGLNVVADGSVTIQSCIVAFSTGGNAIGYNEEPGVISLACTDLYGNSGGGDSDAVWVAAGTECFSADPQFCGIPGSGNFYLQSDSPCVPGNHPDGSACGLIGALPVLCGSVKTEARTWGSIKALYSPDN